LLLSKQNVQCLSTAVDGGAMQVRSAVRVTAVPIWPPVVSSVPLARRPASGSLRRCVQAPHIAREAVDAAAGSWHIFNGSPTNIRKHLQEEQIRIEPSPSKSPRFLEMTTHREDVA
jgi:hypothetical protein